MVAVFLAGAFSLFIFALLETTVANVVFTVGLSPIFAAVFAWLVLREALAPSTFAAIMASVAGLALMVGDGLASGTLLGNALALGACLCYSAALVAMRKGQAVDMIPAVCLAGLLAAVVAAIMALGAPAGLAVSGRDLGLAATLGVVQLGFQYILLTFAIRHVAGSRGRVGRPRLPGAGADLGLARRRRGAEHLDLGRRRRDLPRHHQPRRAGHKAFKSRGSID